MAATCSVRPHGVDKAFLYARRGVRAAPGPCRPMRKQDGQAPTTSVPGSQSRRGRCPNGRKRGQRSAAGSPPTQKKPVMENVVILKRGEQLQLKVTVAPELVPPPAAVKCGAQMEKADEPVKKTEAEEQRGADATKAKDQYVQPAKRNDVIKHVPVSAKKKHGGQGTRVKTAPPVVYSGASFAAAPEPNELPIPVLLLKGLGVRLCPRDHEQAAA